VIRKNYEEGDTDAGECFSNTTIFFYLEKIIQIHFLSFTTCTFLAHQAFRNLSTAQKKAMVL